jgi:hypothetical protein
MKDISITLVRPKTVEPVSSSIIGSTHPADLQIEKISSCGQIREVFGTSRIFANSKLELK